MNGYRIAELAALTGISKRTLHHYDRIGLFKPSKRLDNGYRCYNRKDLLKLQQILFFKELDFPLKQIAEMVGKPHYDPMHALAQHRRLLLSQSKRIQTLIRTVETTISELKEKRMTLTDKELYEGFSDNEIREMKADVKRRFDAETVAASQRRVKQMSKGDWKDIQREQEDIPAELSKLMDRPVSDPAVQQLVGRHFKLMNRFYEVDRSRYLGLAELYVSDERFTDFYDKHRKGLARFLTSAMIVYADQNL